MYSLKISDKTNRMQTNVKNKALTFMQSSVTFPPWRILELNGIPLHTIILIIFLFKNLS